MIPIEKPGSPGDILEHHGVMGMKWGRRTGGSSSGGSSKPKPRGRERSRQFAAKHHSGAERAAAISQARVRDKKRFKAYSNETNPTKKAELKKAYKNHPDRATALRTTRGEKIVLGILAGAVLTTPIAIGVGAGVGVRTARRHKIERAQRK